MAKNTSRRNVIRHDDPSTPRNRMNKPYCMSFIFGRNMKDPDGSMSYWSAKYPKVYSELRDLMAKYDRDFGYTHITLNRNLRCKRHTDGGNAGPSYIAGFGDYRGGGLLVEPPGGGGSSDETTVLDLRGRFVTFNGKTQPHETLAFEGERFTLVYYTSDIKSGGGGERGDDDGNVRGSSSRGHHRGVGGRRQLGHGGEIQRDQGEAREEEMREEARRNGTKANAECAPPVHEQRELCRKYYASRNIWFRFTYIRKQSESRVRIS